MSAHPHRSWRLLEVEAPMALAGACDMLGRHYEPALRTRPAAAAPDPILDDAERAALGLAGAADVISAFDGVRVNF